MNTKENLINLYTNTFSVNPDYPVVIAQAPGRVNIIGEHTDYNNGYVLPMAITTGVSIIGQASRATKSRIYAHHYNATATVSKDNFSVPPDKQWARYCAGVLKTLCDYDYSFPAFDICIASDLPIGAGLSSSASLEVAMAMFLLEIAGENLSREEIALICQKAENEFVGVNCGIMDQFASALSKQHCLLFLDCKTLQHLNVPFPPDYEIVICNTNVKRELTTSAYNARRSACFSAVETLSRFIPGITHLRDVGLEDLVKYGDHLTPEELKRARHVITENKRVLKCVELLKSKQVKLFGKLMNQSHDSLKNDYEVSCAELDTMVELAQNYPHILGARMTGAGFGGCTVNVIGKEHANEFAHYIEKEYNDAAGKRAGVYISPPSAGADVFVL